MKKKHFQTWKKSFRIVKKKKSESENAFKVGRYFSGKFLESESEKHIMQTEVTLKAQGLGSRTPLLSALY